MNIIDCVGIVFDDFLAKATAEAFNAQRLWSAGGKVENTQDRAYLEMISYCGSIKAWIVRVERRDLNECGKPWPPLAQ